MKVSASYIDYLDTPIGLLEIVATNNGVASVKFVETKQAVNANTISEQCKYQLQEYFDGQRVKFDLPLAARGTVFQSQVWQQLCSIGYGQTCSYQHIADKIANPKAVRAVGAANGKNPISIIVPCHRVIGANGRLTGYAGGLDRKAWLLAFETEHHANH